MPEAQAPAVQEEMPDVPVSVNESAPQFIRPVNGVLLRGFSAEALSYDRTMADWRVHRGWTSHAPQASRCLPYPAAR